MSTVNDPAALPAVPPDHPARVLLDPDDQHEFPYLDVELCGGDRPQGLRSLRSWWATATVCDHSDTEPLYIPVARMSITVVNEFLGDPVMELDALDADSMVLSEALWRGDSRTPEFEDVAEDWGPVALINSYQVEPDWRGTPLSPIIALRILEVLAHLDLSAAALYAAPYNSDLPDRDRDVASVKIAAMWKRAGFSHLYPDAAAYTDRGRIMLRTLDAIEIADELNALAGTDPVLQKAIDE